MSEISEIKRKIQRAGLLVLVLLIVAVAAWLTTGGVSNCAIFKALLAESTLVQDKIDVRADEIVSKLDAMDRKLDTMDRKLDDSDKRLKSIDDKLDRLLQLANPPLPDGLQRVD